MKNASNSQTAPSALLAFVLLTILFTLQLAAAEPKERPTAKDILPKPEELGPEWYWPWNIPKQYTFAAAVGDDADDAPGLTESSWRSQFNNNPRGPLLMQAFQLERMTDEEYKESMAGMAALFTALGNSNSAAGTELSGGGAIAKTLEQAQTVNRTQVVAELKAQYYAIKDWAANDYNRAKPNGEKSEIPGYVPHDEDALTFELTLYADDYVSNRKIIFDLSEESLKQAVEERRKTKSYVQKAMDEELDSLTKQYESRMTDVENATKSLQQYREYNYGPEWIASQEKNIEYHKEIAVKIEQAIQRVTTRRSTVKGAMLQNVDGGYLVSETVADSERQRAMIYGKLRRGSAVVDISRSADGAFAAGALDDTLRILNILSARLGEWAAQAVSKEAIQFNAAKTLNYDYGVQADKLPAGLKDKLNTPAPTNASPAALTNSPPD